MDAAGRKEGEKQKGRRELECSIVVCVLLTVLSSCMTLGNLCSFFLPEFYHLRKDHNHSTSGL